MNDYGNTFTEENYLKAIFNLSLQDKSAITTNAIAEAMRTKAASVTDMLKKLAQKKLINYRKYQGVTLTVQGKKIAIGVIRKHRLWEYFLAEKLRFGWDEVHEIAEQLEHISSPELTDKLDQFLGHPKFDPHGDPIPDRNGNISHQQSCRLSDLPVNGQGTMVGVNDHSPSFLKYLAQTGIRLGDLIRITDLIEYDKSLRIKVNTRPHQISKQIADNILVSTRKK